MRAPWGGVIWEGGAGYVEDRLGLSLTKSPGIGGIGVGVGIGIGIGGCIYCVYILILSFLSFFRR